MEFAKVIESQMEKEGFPDVLESQDYLGIGLLHSTKEIPFVPELQRP